MRNHPVGWTYDDVVPILKRLGFVFQSDDSSGSHRWWHHERGAIVGFVDRGHGPMKEVYVKEFLEALDEIQLLIGDED